MLDYIAIGHICADLQADGTTRLGGTALFAALTAHRLGLRAAILTACSPELDLSTLPPDLMVVRQDSNATTVFENRYGPAGRTQLLHARAETIDLQAIPEAWRSTPIVHLAPVIQEVPHVMPSTLGNTLLGLTPQGWLRSVQPNKHVITHPSALLKLPLSSAHLVVMSEEDVQYDEALVRRLAEQISLVVLTRAERGATVWVRGRASNVPALHAEVVDPTGAGDVFAAAFFAALHRGHDPLVAARWACAAAACAIEGPGISALPTAEQVEQRIADASSLM
jgi:sugar/nucleoside kinase (ribokinase family)